MRRMHLHVSGDVQGVCFRMYTCRQARQLQLTGFVRNLPDGSVEVVAEGSTWALKQLMAWCHEGPPMATVSRVVDEYGEATGVFSAFDIVY